MLFLLCITSAIVRREEELLGGHHYPTHLLPVTWVRKCLDYLLRTICLEGCYKAVLGEPSLDHYFLHSLMIFVILRLIVVTFLIFISQKTLLNIKDVEFDFRVGCILVLFPFLWIINVQFANFGFWIFWFSNIAILAYFDSKFGGGWMICHFSNI